MMKAWSNLAAIVARRTYARKDSGHLENWAEIIQRTVAGNVRGHNVPEQEIKDLLRFGYERKAIPAGRGLWFSGSPAHATLGGVALCNCWYLNATHWENFVRAQDLLMLGGGVGISVEHRFTSKLSKIKKDVHVISKPTKDADFIVPDSREGWCELTRRVLESYFVTGKSFSYSTYCLRGAGEPIKRFGGVASGPLPLTRFITNLSTILTAREGSHVRPIDAADIITCIGEMVVSGNVRRSAIIILGDCWDKEYLKAKRWDLGLLPSYRAYANYSVVCDDYEDLHPLYWKTFEQGEAFGIVNRKTIQKFGRMGEPKKDTAEGVNPCAEATLESNEPCNLQEIALPNLESEQEFVEAGVLMHRYGKRVTLEHYHHEEIQEVVARNRRIGTGITGCLASPLFTADVLDHVYAEIQKENVRYSKELGIPESIRTTVIKPSGTVSKVLDMKGYEGIHVAYGRHIVQRIRFAANDPLILLLRAAGHHIEPVKKLDGTLDYGTLVVDFYVQAPENCLVADENWTTWQQLEVYKLAQKHWSDQSVSVSIYYDRSEISKLKDWIRDNLKEIKSISFLCYNNHGFVQAPKERITKEAFDRLSAAIQPLDVDLIGEGDEIDGLECEGGVCPTK
jgi:ribonucleoside-triphosphate reductase (thioredoxin)